MRLGFDGPSAAFAGESHTRVEDCCDVSVDVCAGYEGELAWSCEFAGAMVCGGIELEAD